MANDANTTGNSQEGHQEAATNSKFDNIKVNASSMEDRRLFRGILKRSNSMHGNSYKIVERTEVGYRLELVPGAKEDNGVPLAYGDILKWEASLKPKHPCIKVLRPVRENRPPGPYPNDVVKGSRGDLLSPHYSGVYEDMKGDLWIDGGSDIKYRNESNDRVATAQKAYPEAKIKAQILGCEGYMILE